LLETGAHDRDRARTLPSAGPARHNPLRLASNSSVAAQVTPTAAWTSESRPATSRPADRYNPLRDN
jgi:hypothetical protein